MHSPQPRSLSCGDQKILIRQPIDIQGTIKFTDDTDYWQANSFPFVFQNVTSFFKLGGDDVFIYGGRSLFLSPLYFHIHIPASRINFLGEFVGIGVLLKEHKAASAVTNDIRETGCILAVWEREREEKRGEARVERDKSSLTVL